MKLTMFRLGTVRAFVVDYYLLSIIILAVFVRLYGITNAAVWFDEAYSVLASDAAPPLIWFYAANDVHPPLYYFLLHVWMVYFGDSIIAIRTMSVVIGAMTVVLGVWLMSLIATRRAAVLGGILLATLPIAVRYSQEARMYALLGLWCIAATLALVYWVRAPHQFRYLFVYTLLMVAAFYTHYFAGPCLFAHWLYVLLLQGRGVPTLRKPAWWLTNITIVVLYIPWLPSLYAQFATSNGLLWTPPATLFLLVSQLWQFLILEDGFGLPVIVYVSLPLAVASAAGLLIALDHSPYRFNALLVIYIVAPLLVVALVSLRMPLFWTRYFLFSAIGLPLLMGLALDKLLDRQHWLGVAAAGVLMGLQVYGLSNVYSGKFTLNSPGVQTQVRIDKALDYLTEAWAAGDRILVYGVDMTAGALYYNKTGTQLLLYTPGSPLEGHPGNRNIGSILSRSPNISFISHLECLPVGAQRIWFLYSSQQRTLAVPVQWRAISHFTAGDTQLWLYSLEQPAPR